MESRPGMSRLVVDVAVEVKDKFDKKCKKQKTNMSDEIRVFIRKYVKGGLPK